jgi:hypothetical protein
VKPSSEAEPCSRGRPALDRDGTSLEGASSPRARRNPAQGGDQPPSEAGPHPRGDQPSSEAEFYQRGIVPLERSGVPSEGGLGRLSGGPWARGFISRAFLGSFAFVFYEGKRVLLGCLGDPYGCPRQEIYDKNMRKVVASGLVDVPIQPASA